MIAAKGRWLGNGQVAAFGVESELRAEGKMNHMYNSGKSGFFRLSRPELCTEYWESNLTVKIMVEAEKRHGPSLTSGDNIKYLVIGGQRSFSIPCALSRQVQRPSVKFPKTSALDVVRDRSPEALRIIKLARNLSKREVKGRMVAKIGIHRRQTSSGDL
ncbi:hypothetical protein B0H14DRAFT_2574171 [Mycena olivaceomarginata]|nr:hypothetical protein B0H14DRAFT_2574171 [Mycena olivaceomarginata]